MWAGLGAYIAASWARVWGGASSADDVKEPELVLENCALTAAQISTGRKALRILALEPKQFALDRKDVLIFLYAMGLNPTDDVIDVKLRQFKLFEAETFTFGQLAHIWHSMLQDRADEEEILRHAFQFFDKDGNGDISIAELRSTMHELGGLLRDDEILLFLTIMDVDHDGVITYEEFLNTLAASASELHNMSEALPDIATPMATFGQESSNMFRGSRVAPSGAPAAAAAAAASGSPTPHWGGGAPTEEGAERSVRSMPTSLPKAAPASAAKGRRWSWMVGASSDAVPGSGTNTSSSSSPETGGSDRGPGSSTVPITGTLVVSAFSEDGGVLGGASGSGGGSPANGGFVNGGSGHHHHSPQGAGAGHADMGRASSRRASGVGSVRGGGGAGGGDNSPDSSSHGGAGGISGGGGGGGGGSDLGSRPNSAAQRRPSRLSLAERSPSLVLSALPAAGGGAGGHLVVDVEPDSPTSLPSRSPQDRGLGFAAQLPGSIVQREPEPSGPSMMRMVSLAYGVAGGSSSSGGAGGSSGGVGGVGGGGSAAVTPRSSSPPPPSLPPAPSLARTSSAPPVEASATSPREFEGLVVRTASALAPSPRSAAPAAATLAATAADGGGGGAGPTLTAAGGGGVQQEALPPWPSVAPSPWAATIAEGVEEDSEEGGELAVGRGAGAPPPSHPSSSSTSSASAHIGLLAAAALQRGGSGSGSMRGSGNLSAAAAPSTSPPPGSPAVSSSGGSTAIAGRRAAPQSPEKGSSTGAVGGGGGGGGGAGGGGAAAGRRASAASLSAAPDSGHLRSGSISALGGSVSRGGGGVLGVGPSASSASFSGPASRPGSNSQLGGLGGGLVRNGMSALLPSPTLHGRRASHLGGPAGAPPALAHAGSLGGGSEFAESLLSLELGGQQQAAAAARPDSRQVSVTAGRRDSSGAQLRGESSSGSQLRVQQLSQ